MTAVEIFFEDLVHLGYIEYPDENLVQDRLKQALEMEKQQIVDAFKKNPQGYNYNGEKYYNDTYKKEIK